MIVPKEALTELIEIHRNLTGETLTESQAFEMGENLFELFLSVYEPIPEKWLEEFQNLVDSFKHSS